MKKAVIAATASILLVAAGCADDRKLPAKTDRHGNRVYPYRDPSGDVINFQHERQRDQWAARVREQE